MVYYVCTTAYEIVYIVCRVCHMMSQVYDMVLLHLDIIDSMIFLIYSDDILRVCVMRKNINLHSNYQVHIFMCVVKGVISIATSPLPTSKLLFHFH